MRYALSVPNFGDFADPHVTIGLARDAEAAGWDAFFLWDHLLASNGNVVADPWTLLAAIAVSTERIRLGTMVTPLPRRRPWQVVRQIVTLDHLSGGRATLGVGLGFPPKEEFELFGESGDARVRAELLDEALDVAAGLMSGGPFSYDGRHFRLDGVEFAPRPVQSPRVPIWVAGAWPARPPFRRAARYDGVVPIAKDANGEEILIDVPTMREVVAYTDEHRTDDRAVRPRLHRLPAGGRDRGERDRGRARVVRRHVVAGGSGAGRTTRRGPRLDPRRAAA